MTVRRPRAWGTMSGGAMGDGAAGEAAVGMAGRGPQRCASVASAPPNGGSNEGMGAWGTCAELLLVSAVKKHGVPNWGRVALELKSRAILLDIPPSWFSDERCRFKFNALKGQFGGDGGASTTVDDGGGVSWFDELRKVRMSHLKEVLQVHDSSIGQLQSTISKLMEERTTVRKDDGSCEADVSTSDRSESDMRTPSSEEPPNVCSRDEDHPKRSVEADFASVPPITDRGDLETGEDMPSEERDCVKENPPGSPGTELVIVGSPEGTEIATGSPRKLAHESEAGALPENLPVNEESVVGRDAEGMGMATDFTTELRKPESGAPVLEQHSVDEETVVGQDGVGMEIETGSPSNPALETEADVLLGELSLNEESRVGKDAEGPSKLSVGEEGVIGESGEDLEKVSVNEQAVVCKDGENVEKLSVNEEDTEDNAVCPAGEGLERLPASEEKVVGEDGEGLEKLSEIQGNAVDKDEEGLEKPSENDEVVGQGGEGLEVLPKIEEKAVGADEEGLEKISVRGENVVGEDGQGVEHLSETEKVVSKDEESLEEHCEKEEEGVDQDGDALEMLPESEDKIAGEAEKSPEKLSKTDDEVLGKDGEGLEKNSENGEKIAGNVEEGLETLSKTKENVVGKDEEGHKTLCENEVKVAGKDGEGLEKLFENDEKMAGKDEEGLEKLSENERKVTGKDGEDPSNLSENEEKVAGKDAEGLQKLSEAEDSILVKDGEGLRKLSETEEDMIIGKDDEGLHKLPETREITIGKHEDGPENLSETQESEDGEPQGEEAAKSQTGDLTPSLVELDSEKLAEGSDQPATAHPSEIPCAAEIQEHGVGSMDEAEDPVVGQENLASEDMPVSAAAEVNLAEVQARGGSPPPESTTTRMEVDLVEVPLPDPPQSDDPTDTAETPITPSEPSEAAEPESDRGAAVTSSDSRREPRLSRLSLSYARGLKRLRDSAAKAKRDEKEEEPLAQAPAQAPPADDAHADADDDERPRQRQRTVEASEILTVDLTVVEQAPAAPTKPDDGTVARISRLGHVSPSDEADGGGSTGDKSQHDASGDDAGDDETVAATELSAIPGREIQESIDNDPAPVDAKSEPRSPVSHGEAEPMSLVVDLQTLAETPTTAAAGHDSPPRGEGIWVSADGPRDVRARSPEPPADMATPDEDPGFQTGAGPIEAVVGDEGTASGHRAGTDFAAAAVGDEELPPERAASDSAAALDADIADSGNVEKGESDAEAVGGRDETTAEVAGDRKPENRAEEDSGRREEIPEAAGDRNAEDRDEGTNVIVERDEEEAELEVKLGRGPEERAETVAEVCDGHGEAKADEIVTAGDVHGEKIEEVDARPEGRGEKEEEEDVEKVDPVAGMRESTGRETAEGQRGTGTTTPPDESRDEDREAEERQPAGVPDSGDSQIDKSEVGSSMDSVEDMSPSSRKNRREPRVPGKLLPLLECLRAICSHKSAPMFKQRQEYQESARYERLVKRHVDLGMVRSRLEDGAYSGSVEFFRDLLLIFTNALVYNRSDSPEYAGAKALRSCALAEMDRIMQTEAVLKQSGPATRKREGRKPAEAARKENRKGRVSVSSGGIGSEGRKKGAAAGVKGEAVAAVAVAPAVEPAAAPRIATRAAAEEATPQAASRATGSNRDDGGGGRVQNGRSGSLKKLPWNRIQEGSAAKKPATGPSSAAAAGNKGGGGSAGGGNSGKKGKADGALPSRGSSKGQATADVARAGSGRPIVKKGGAPRTGGGSKTGSVAVSKAAAAAAAPAKMKDVMCIDVERKGHLHNWSGVAAAEQQPAGKKQQHGQQQRGQPRQQQQQQQQQQAPPPRPVRQASASRVSRSSKRAGTTTTSASNPKKRVRK